jgi:hypothetical protein
MLDALTDTERETVRRALDAAANGPFFPDWEFDTIFGVEREKVTSALRRFPKLDGEDDFLAVNNSLLWLVAYPHGCDVELATFQLDKNSLVAIHRKWRQSLGKDAGQFFDFVE